MKPAWTLALAAAALAAATLAAAGTSRPPAPQQSSSAADDPAAPLFARMCVLCHEAARITAQRRTAVEWEEVLTKMAERGAQGTEQEFDTVYEFLLRHHAKVHINGAPAEDIEKILAISKKDAEAIVAYRKTNGPFKDFDALKKVPDIDVKKLEERRDAVFF